MSQHRSPNRPVVYAIVAAFLAAVGIIVLVVFNRTPPRAPAPPSAGGPPGPAPDTAELTPQPEVLDVSQEPTMQELQPAPISLDVQDGNPKDALSALADAASLRVEITRIPGKPLSAGPHVTLHLRNVPLLEAIYLVAQSTHDYPDIWDASRLHFRNPSSPFTAEVKSVWSVAGRFATEIRDVQNAADTQLPLVRSGVIAIAMTFIAEPAVNVRQFPDGPVVTRMVDENGKDLMPGQPHPDPIPVRDVGGITAGNWRHAAAFQFPPPPQMGHKIADFTGYSVFTIAANSETLTTASLDEKVSRDMADFKVDVSGIEPAPTAAQNAAASANPPSGFPITAPFFSHVIHVHYTRGAIKPADWPAAARALEACTPMICDAAGKPYAPSRPNEQITESTADFTFPFRLVRGPVPDHLTLTVSLGQRSVHVPFAFKDLPLP